MSQSDTDIGKNYTLEYFDGSNYRFIGGINNLSYTMDNPVADMTSQSTTGDISESAFTGFSDVSFSGSGALDKRTSATLIPSMEFIKAAQTGDREAQLRVKNSDITITGNFVITSIGLSSEKRGLQNFTMSAQSASNVTIV